MITDIEEFIKHFHGQRRRTQWIVDAVPPEKADWRPWPGEDSPAEIIRRIAAGHLMYATAVAHDYWAVDDYEVAATTWEESLKYFHEKTEEALDLLRALPDSVLQQKRRRPDENIRVAAWRYLMAMLEHEIYYRSQLGSYLMLLNVRRPKMGGITIEAVREALNSRQTL
jgi:uncharacterized damage-inducible protein DinB